MKNSVLLIVSLFLCFSCSKDKDDNPIVVTPELVGIWKLTEMYSDPGDGSGEFTAVESNKTVTFGTDKVISSNGNLCFMSVESDDPSEGIYTPEDQTFTIADCGNVPFSSSYEIVGENLIISYPCIEPCKEKYIRLGNNH